MKSAQADRCSRIMTPLRLPPELRFLQRWNMFSGSWQICHISKIFPINTLVALNGVGVCRVVSDPSMPRRRGYPQLTVESSGERIRVDVIEITRISN